jgi:hypothetical protein
LLGGEPMIAVNESRVPEGVLVVNPMALRADDLPRLVARLRSVLAERE